MIEENVIMKIFNFKMYQL